MQDDIRAPTLLRDLRALADLYIDLARLMLRRLTGKAGWDRSRFYGPIEIIRPDVDTEPDSPPADTPDPKIIRFFPRDGGDSAKTGAN